jgi:hypothetical protein
MSITSKFVKTFDASSETHVKWLAHMCDIAEGLSPDKPTMLMDEINLNPLKIKVSGTEALDWPHIHFCLCAVYAKAVLRNTAWLPPRSV